MNGNRSCYSIKTSILDFYSCGNVEDVTFKHDDKFMFFKSGVFCKILTSNKCVSFSAWIVICRFQQEETPPPHLLDMNAPRWFRSHNDSHFQKIQSHWNKHFFPPCLRIISLLFSPLCLLTSCHYSDLKGSKKLIITTFLHSFVVTGAAFLIILLAELIEMSLSLDLISGGYDHQDKSKHI